MDPSWSMSSEYYGHMQAAQESQLPKSECPGHECFWFLLGAVDHPDTLPLSYMQKKRERKMDPGNKSFPPDGRADEPDCGSISGKPLSLSPTLDK